MVAFFLIAIVAGAASGLLAAGAAAGPMSAVPLFYLAPLPVMIAGMAFSPVAALIAVAGAGAGLGLVFGGPFLIAYLMAMGLPAFALSYAALLARPEPAGRDGLVWFAVGDLVLMAAAFATLAVLVAVSFMAADYDSYRAAIVNMVDLMTQGHTAVPPEHETVMLGALVARVLPPVAGVVSMLSLLGCLYLAGRAAQVSGRLARPWPTLSAFRMAPMALLLLAGAVALSLMPGLPGLFASVAAATLALAYALAGFAVVHAVTEGMSARFLILAALWGTTLLLGWPLLAMVVLGLADAVLDLRAKLATGEGPPAANDR